MMGNNADITTNAMEIEDWCLFVSCSTFSFRLFSQFLYYGISYTIVTMMILFRLLGLDETSLQKY